ncbi:odorant receptor 63a-like isoform X1 [Microplitis mediator]|uniref:odorant receptor 63a-like isoform X1 n=1 Tax=Microplitis mediator TaxID=375433 RepID=UPI0025548723|nr:odorant receptor 63a-like isoform X1 [Microplitis mediator]
MKNKIVTNDIRTVHWTKDSINAIGLYKYIIQIICSWPLELRNVYWKIRSILFVTYLITSDIFLAQEFLNHCGTSYEITSLFGLIFAAVSGHIKILFLHIYNDNIKFIVTNFINDWSVIEDEKSRKIMRQYSSLNRILFVCILTSMFCYQLKLTIEGLPQKIIIDNITVIERLLPLSAKCWDFSDTPIVIYAFRFGCRIFEFIIYNITSCGIDLYFFILAMHFCGQMEITNSNLKNFKTITNGVFDNKKFYGIIIRQKYLFDLMNLLRESFNYTILTVLLISGIHLNIMIIMIFIALKNNDINSVIRDAAGTILYFFSQIFIYCYAGEKLSSVIQNSCFSVYSCYWYNFSIKTRKDIKYIMLRNSQEFHFTVGKFYHMNLENCTGIVKTLVSFFSVMRLVIFE